MNLTEEQVQNLYNFVRSRHVEFYDIQTELVDHLANDIEFIWTENPELTFLQARSQAFKKFGISGFSKIVEKKQKQLTKHYWKLTWIFFKDYFKLPKIIFTSFLITLTYLILDFIPNKNIFLNIWVIVWVITGFFILTYRVTRLKKLQKKTGKKWLFENINATLGGYINVVNLLLQIILYNKSSNYTQTTLILIASGLMLLSILHYILIKIIPPKLEEIYTKQYPEHKLYRQT